MSLQFPILGPRDKEKKSLQGEESAAWRHEASRWTASARARGRRDRNRDREMLIDNERRGRGEKTGKETLS